VWVRGVADRSSANSVHVGLDGVETASSGNINFPISSTWVWTGGVGVASIQVNTPGVHTINVWMREAGFRIDKLVVTTDAALLPSGAGPVESLRDTGSGGSSLFEDNFNDGNALGWTVTNNCIKGTSSWVWVSNTLMQTGDCRGYSPEGVAIASHALSDVTLPNNVDIQLRLRSADPDTDGTALNDGNRWKFDTIGILFGYQNNDNYYRFEFDGMKGHRKLWRKQGGMYTELNTSPQSFVRGQWVNLRVVHQNGVILIFVDGQQVMAVADATFSSGKLALFCARNASCSFDDIQVVTAPSAPMLGLLLPDSVVHASSEYFVNTDGVLDVSAISTISGGIGGVELVADEGTGAELLLTDLVAPYNGEFNALAAGNHVINGYLLDSNGVRITAPEAMVSLPLIGTGGIHLYVLGDSITNGIEDDLPGDDTSTETRNTGGGYAPLLNNLLRADNSVPVTVLNDGNPGEESSEGAQRIAAVIQRTPAVQAYLVSYGANDSGGSMPTPSGLDLGPADSGYAGSFKDNLQRLINAVTMPVPSGAGKLIFLAKAPPYLANSMRNTRVAEYNQVVDQLVTENGFSYAPPDFFTYFTINPGEFSSDGIHPNGAGYQSMGNLWCQGLNGQMGLMCIP